MHNELKVVQPPMLFIPASCMRGDVAFPVKETKAKILPIIIPPPLHPMQAAMVAPPYASSTRGKEKDDLEGIFPERVFKKMKRGRNS